MIHISAATQLFMYLAFGLIVLGFSLFVYLLALTPAEVSPEVGIKGLKRKAALAEEGLFTTIEPFMRWLARRIATLPLEGTRERINTNIRHGGEYLGLTADESST